MKRFSKRVKKTLIVLGLALLIKLFSLQPAWVEAVYSNGIYIGISWVQRFLLGWIPFSVGDLLYAAAVIFLLVKLVKAVRTIFRRQADKAFWLKGLQQVVFWILCVYVAFNLLWGLNYNRLGPARQLQLAMKPYTNDELKTVVQAIIRRLDETNAGAVQVREQYNSHRALFGKARESYQLAQPLYPFLSYRAASVKSSLFSYLGDYLGYTGYYNPFTGEAQVNTTVPVFVLPFTTCHEIGHQLGYAKENEANFAGYLSAKSSTDMAFRYSVYLDLYGYSIRELYFRDSLAAKAMALQVPPQVKKDFAELRAFDARYKNPLEPYIRRLYGEYLRANQQPHGLQSYSEVMAFLVAYYRKYGEI